MKLLGSIAKLQVQVESLKIGEPFRRRYDPAGIRDVPLVLVTESGVEGRMPDGRTLADVHDSRHPLTKNRGGSNGISIGFTSHYSLMRSRFGAHLEDGIAGENILVRTLDPNAILTQNELAAGLLIQTAGCERLELDELIVAAPCVEFARFALRFPDDERPDRTVTEAVRFLDHGVRGFYARCLGSPAPLRHGDLVYAI